MKLSNWNIEIRTDQFLIDSLYLRPADVDKLSSLLSFAQRMDELEVLPEEIGDPPFKVIFSDTGELTVKRTDTPQISEFKVVFGDIDKAIRTIYEAKKMSLDASTLNPAPSLTGQSFSRIDYDGI